MFKFIFSLLMAVSFSQKVFAQESLVDLVSPDELVEELGLPSAVLPSAVQAAGAPSAEATELSPMAGMDRELAAPIDVTQYFPVVVLVNKANSGPTAQTMKVYHRGVLTYTFKVSTGRETPENAKSGRQYFSTTSVGWYAPTRTYDKYYSNTWLAWMNNSIFFNGGLALHATTPDHFKELGHRASGGCVRLHPKDAKVLYDLVLGEGKGQVPAYTVDGKILKSAFGQIKFREHWNTLIIIQDNPGL